MSNSNLVTYTDLSPNHSGARTKKICRFTPHCYVGQVTVERGCKSFEDPKRNASCNYLIGTDGRIALVVPEGFRSWCTSSNYNDQMAITTECACDSTAPYAFNQKVWDSLVALAVDCCKRNGKKKFIYIPDKTAALAYKPADDEMLMTFHRWYAKKSCPGDWFVANAQRFADEVNEKLNGFVEVPIYTKPHAGEGLRAIARRCGITFDEIKRLNPWCKAPMYLVPMRKDVRIK